MKSAIKFLFYGVIFLLMTIPAYAKSSPNYGEGAAAKLIRSDQSIVARLSEVEKWAKEHYSPKHGYWRDADAFDNEDYSLVAVSTGWNLRVRNGHFRGSVVTVNLYWDGRIIVLEGDNQAYGGTWYPKLEIQKTRR